MHPPKKQNNIQRQQDSTRSTLESIIMTTAYFFWHFFVGKKPWEISIFSTILGKTHRLSFFFGPSRCDRLAPRKSRPWVPRSKGRSQVGPVSLDICGGFWFLVVFLEATKKKIDPTGLFGRFVMICAISEFLTSWWCFTNPSEKYESNWIISPRIGVKTKNIWNHHLAYVCYLSIWCGLRLLGGFFLRFVR